MSQYLFQGIKNKVEIVESICTELNISLQDCAFIGDDINDLSLLQKVGFSASPKNAPEYIQSKVNLVTNKKGGEGAFREFVEHILMENNLLEDIIEKAVAGHGKTS